MALKFDVESSKKAKTGFGQRYCVSACSIGESRVLIRWLALRLYEETNDRPVADRIFPLSLKKYCNSPILAEPKCCLQYRVSRPIHSWRRLQDTLHESSTYWTPFPGDHNFHHVSVACPCNLLRSLLSDCMMNTIPVAKL